MHYQFQVNGLFALLPLLLFGILFSVLCKKLAAHKGYSGYAVMGFFLGIIALLYVGFLPDRSNQARVEERTHDGEAPVWTLQEDAPPRQSASTAAGAVSMISCPHCGERQFSNRATCKRCGKELEKEA